MKTQCLLLVIVLVWFWVPQKAEAQKRLRQGVITYKVDYEVDTLTLMDSEMKAMVDGMKIKIAFQGPHLREEMSILGGMFSVAVIRHADRPDEDVVLVSFMGQTMQVEGNDVQTGQFNILDMSKGGTGRWTKEKRTIKGYKCRKAIVEISEGEGEVEFWLTKKIKAQIEPFAQGVSAPLKGKGIPLAFSISIKDTQLQFMATDIDSEVTAADFQVPADVQKISLEELQQLLEQQD